MCGQIRKTVTITIFDWDDTLLPSSWLLLMNAANISPAQLKKQPKIVEALEFHQRHVVDCLMQAKSHGPVAIITNSLEGWVQASARMFLPQVLDVLSDIPIISGQSLCHHLSPDPWIWKHYAFSFYCGAILNTQDIDIHSIFSVGDSPQERASLVRTAQDIPGVLMKSVKLSPTKSLGELSLQLQHLSTNLTSLYSAPCNQDLTFDPCLQNLIPYTPGS
mmetsp:Transcript_2451/g.3479  ORF Transcript_2451/g.3479 Transcript_2451/m.3479 type:complete len:219 (+) Transcript_2451:115-771(+)